MYDSHPFVKTLVSIKFPKSDIHARTATCSNPVSGAASQSTRGFQVFSPLTKRRLDVRDKMLKL